MEAKLDPLDLLPPGSLDCCSMTLAQLLLDYFLFSDPVEKTNRKVWFAVFDTDLLATTSQRPRAEALRACDTVYAVGASPPQHQ